MNDARCVHCVQLLLTVASILHHMSFHLRICFATCVLARKNVLRFMRTEDCVLRIVSSCEKCSGIEKLWLDLVNVFRQLVIWFRGLAFVF